MVQVSTLTRPVAYIRVTTDAEAKLFEEQASTIVVLTKGCKSVKIVRDVSEVPEGCASAVLSPTIVVHALIKVRETSLPIVLLVLIYPRRVWSIWILRLSRTRRS